MRLIPSQNRKPKPLKYQHTKQGLTALVAVGVIALANISTSVAELAGTVQMAGSPVTGSTVTLYAASTDAPTQLAQGKTDDDGAFKLETGKPPADSVLYVIAKGGTTKAAAGKGPNEAIALLTVLGTALPETVTVNELTTVASAFTAARFINGEAISGKCARTADCGRECAEPGGSRDRHLGKGALGST